MPVERGLVRPVPDVDGPQTPIENYINRADDIGGMQDAVGDKEPPLVGVIS